jgi:hypothetical protein
MNDDLTTTLSLNTYTRFKDMINPGLMGNSQGETPQSMQPDNERFLAYP